MTASFDFIPRRILGHNRVDEMQVQLDQTSSDLHKMLAFKVPKNN